MPREPKPPISAWIIQERKRLKLKPGDVAHRLTAMGLPTAEGTPRTWEAGRSPSPENIEGLERLFETRAPASDELSLISALTAQTAAISELVAQVQALVAGRDEEIVNAVSAAVALAVRTTLQAAGIAGEPRRP